MLPVEPLNMIASTVYDCKYVAYLRFTLVILFAYFFYIYTKNIIRFPLLAFIFVLAFCVCWLLVLLLLLTEFSAS